MLDVFTWGRVSASVWLLLARSRCCEGTSCSAHIWLLGSFAQDFMRWLWSCLWICITWIFRLAGVCDSRHHFLLFLIMINVNASSCCSDVLKLDEHLSLYISISSVPFPCVWDSCVGCWRHRWIALERNCRVLTAGFMDSEAVVHEPCSLWSAQAFLKPLRNYSNISEVSFCKICLIFVKCMGYLFKMFIRAK